MSTAVCADRGAMDLSAIALQGLHEADAQLNAAATKIASFGSSAPDGAGLDTVDLSAEVVALISARNQTAANLATVNTASEIQKNVIDLMA
jgi:flagellar hook protein FlgE